MVSPLLEFFKPFAHLFAPLRRLHDVWQQIVWLGVACGVIAWFLSDTVNRPHPELFAYQFPDEAQWITPKGDAQTAGVFRVDFRLPPKKIARAWVAVSADNGFEVIVNSNPCGRWTLYRATRPFQSGHSEYGQRLRFQPTAIGLNFPREYQWDDNKNYQLPTFLDITRYLKAGEKNSLCVTAQARHPNPSFVLTGEIIFESGERMPIHSHAGWKGSYVPFGANDREWTSPHFPIDHWPNARLRDAPLGSMWRVPPPGIFEAPFRRNWRLAPKDGEAIFRTRWTVNDEFDAAWLRILSLGPYTLRINGNPIRPITGPGYHYAQGMWLAQPANRRILEVMPDQVDPDEAGGAHVGDNFLNPAHGDPVADDFSVSESGLDLSQDSSSDPERGDQLRRQMEDKKARPNMTDAVAEAIDTRMPMSLSRRHAQPDLVGFDVTPWLEPGENEIEIELVQVAKEFNMPNSRRIAVDAGLVAGEQSISCLGDTQSWTINGQRSMATMPPKSSIIKQKFYRIKQPKAFPHYYVAATATALAWLILVTAFFARGIDKSFIDKSISPWWSAALVVLLGAGLKITMAERSDYLWFITNQIWQWMILALAVTVAFTMPRFQYGSNPQRHQKKHVWRIALLAVLFLGLIVRFTGVDDQPLDDDEYASVQTTLNVAKSGLPEIYKGIWYTRGPVYHYLAGGLIYLFGDNIWVMRAPAILAGIVAAVFTYLLGSRVVKSQPIGVAAALIVCLNPFCVFTSHVARFYQQQQTMTVATVFFFIAGFISQSIWWKRAMAFICFGIAVLSQEISLLLIVPCAMCYALMARPESLRNELRFAAVAGLVVVLIGINLVTFKVKCLTRLEGISPNIESTMSPHFSYPMNFLSLFIGYSRLHVLFAPFAMLGMVICLKKRATGMLAVTFFLMAGIFSTVLLVTGLGFRYQYSYLPLWVIASVFGIRAVSDKITRGWSHSAQHFLSLIIITFGLLSFSPWKIPGSYNIRILPDSSGAAAFVRANLRPGDKIAITEPHPHCALLEAGRADYDICMPILYDFVYRSEDDGRLIDRNGGAESMGRIGTLQRAMAQHDRIWILLNREKIKNVSRNFRWEYAGARFDFFVRQNCQVMYHAYSWDVYLWERKRGVLQSFRMEPEAWAE